MKDIKKGIRPDIGRDIRPDIGRVIEPDHNIDPALKEGIERVSKIGAMDKVHAQRGFEKSQKEGVLVEEPNEKPSLDMPIHSRPRKQQED